MPRFENEGFKNNKNRDDIDRTVPDDENYYGASPVDLDFNNRSRDDDIVRDNQRRGINPTDYANFESYNESYDNSYDKDESDYNNFEQREMPQHFVSETYEDFDTGRDSEKSSRRKSAVISKSSGKRSPGGKKPFKMTKGRAVLAVLLVIVLLLGIAVTPVLARINYDDKLESEYVNQSELADSGMVKNILLLGVDARSDDAAETSRSDTMMLVSVDLKHRCIKLISFLRDTWVYIPSMDGEQRLNAACSDGGYQNVVDTIEYNFGVNIDSYVVTDFEMFKVLVDSLGGVEIDVSEAEANEVTNHPKRYGGVELESGTNTLTGEQALAYCRIRKIDTDFVRTERQRTVMSAILTTALKSSPIKLYKMAFNSAPYIETNMGKGELAGFVAMAGIAVTGGIYQTQVPFDGTWDYATIQGNSVISINTEENRERLEEYIYDLSRSDIEAEENEE